jgi:hypothetical protein
MNTYMARIYIAQARATKHGKHRQAAAGPKLN